MRGPRRVAFGRARGVARLALTLSLLLSSLLLSQGASAAANDGSPAAWPSRPAGPYIATGAVDLVPGGADPDWSSQNKIIFQRPDAFGITQVLTVNPDGSDLRQLKSPSLYRHKFNPSWYPDGNWFAVQVERPNKLMTLDSYSQWSNILLNGLWCDLWVAKADGSEWYQLTDTTLRTDGVLFPIFSPDGSKLLWSRIIKPANPLHPWGVYRLMIGDFSFVNGIPQLSNVQDITPNGIEFIEPGQFSPDGRSVVVSSDVGATPNNRMNVLEIDLATDTYVDLTKDSDLVWHEHPSYTPDGQHIIYMSGIPWHPLSADLVMINRDGSGWTQLTHFNDPGYAEYAREAVDAFHARYSPDGKRLALTVQSVPNYPARDLWVLTFP